MSVTNEMIAAARRILEIYEEREAEYRSLVERKVPFVERMRMVRHHYGRAASVFTENIADFTIRTIEFEESSDVYQVQATAGEITGLFNDTRGPVTDFSKGQAAKCWARKLIMSIE